MRFIPSGQPSEEPTQPRGRHRAAQPGIAHFLRRNQTLFKTLLIIHSDRMTLAGRANTDSASHSHVGPSREPSTWLRNKQGNCPITLVDSGQPSSLTFTPSSAIGPVPVRHGMVTSLNVLDAAVYCTVEAPHGAKAPLFKLHIAGGTLILTLRHDVKLSIH